MPDALSFAPGDVPELSRCAITTIVSGLLPGTTAITFTSRVGPNGATSASKMSRCARRPTSAKRWTTQFVALAAPSLPGARSGALRASSTAKLTAVVWSKEGSRRGCASSFGWTTLNAAARSGTATTAQEAR